MKRLIVIPLYEMMGWNQIYMLLFVLCVVAMRYGALTFVLSRTVKRHSNREKIDALFSIGILALVFWQHRDEIFHTTYGHIGLNILYVLLAIVLFYAVNIIVGEKLGGVKSKNQQQIEKLTKEMPFAISLCCTGILAPIFEEVFFRFYIQDLVFGNTVVGILVVSLLFAFMHLVTGFTAAGLLTYMGASIVIGVLYNLTGGLLFSSIMHVTVNSLAVVFMYYGSKLQKRDEEKGKA